MWLPVYQIVYIEYGLICIMYPYAYSINISFMKFFYWIYFFQQSPRGDIDNGFVAKSCLSPPSPPVLAPQPKLRRMSSSTLSLSSRTKKKILTVRFMMICKYFNYHNMDLILLYISIFFIKFNLRFQKVN